MATMIDETVILRYLLKDHAHLSNVAAETITKGDVYVYPEIITRVAVVLRDVYKVPRSAIAGALDKLLDDVNAAEKDALRLACRYFGSTTMDFTDCMMLARNIYNGYTMLSFNKAFMKKTLP